MRIQNEAGFYLSVELQGRVDIVPDYPGYEHFHPFWELVWAEAPICISCAGSTAVTCAAILPSGVQHRVSGAGRACRMLYLGFRFACGESPQQMLEIPEDPLFADACARLLQLPQEEFFAVQSDVLVLLSRLLHVLPAAGTELSHRAALTEKVRRLCAPKHNYSVQQMAGMLYVSPNYLSDVFRSETGMRIKEYQTLMRMEEALHLLVSTDLPVAAIAQRLGYSNPSYFIRCFEQYYHRTPGAVRQAGAEEEK